MNKRSYSKIYLIIFLVLISSAAVILFFNKDTTQTQLTPTEQKPIDVSVTIPEGFSIRLIDERLSNEGVIKKGSLIAFSQEPSMWPSSWKTKWWYQIARERKSLEGFLFPDTYRFFFGRESQYVAEIMVNNFEKKTSSYLISSTSQEKYEIVILASILEKEVRTAQEMSEVAGIFRNRLKIGMPLQSDATFRYVAPSQRNRLSAEEVRKKSPYNTYQIIGYPPTPISNPGLNALKAALNPSETEYFYFLTDQSGKPYYARTLEEHILNRKFLD